MSLTELEQAARDTLLNVQDHLTRKSISPLQFEALMADIRRTLAKLDDKLYSPGYRTKLLTWRGGRRQ